jgi:hypothetical protein
MPAVLDNSLDRFIVTRFVIRIGIGRTKFVGGSSSSVETEPPIALYWY